MLSRCTKPTMNCFSPSATDGLVHWFAEISVLRRACVRWPLQERRKPRRSEDRRGFPELGFQSSCLGLGSLAATIGEAEGRDAADEQGDGARLRNGSKLGVVVDDGPNGVVRGVYTPRTQGLDQAEVVARSAGRGEGRIAACRQPVRAGLIIRGRIGTSDVVASDRVLPKASARIAGTEEQEALASSRRLRSPIGSDRRSSATHRRWLCRWKYRSGSPRRR